MRQLSHLLLLLFVGTSLQFVAGCQQATGGANGAVTLDGTPVDGGSIAFIPLGGGEQQRVGAPIAKGRYTIAAAQGLVPGRYRVEIHWPRKTGRKLPIPDDPPNQMDETIEVVPAKFNARSELLRDVGPGATVLDFELATK